MPDFPTSLVEFQRQSPDDDACAAWLIAACWPSGFMSHMRLRRPRGGNSMLIGLLNSAST